uniref:Uncharacterized protein n=1 Tax=Acrobeloides nanus TaxID=290746 RepID=A0A914EAB0_9BILA
MFSHSSILCYLKLALFSVVVTRSMALRCYQTNKETKETVVVENENYVYCSIFPSLVGNPHLTKSSSDGLISAELDMPFEKFFEENDNTYNMLSVCLYEKYDWPKTWNPKFHSADKKAPEIELILRCVCNYDLCNGPSSFSDYINRLSNI